MAEVTKRFYDGGRIRYFDNDEGRVRHNASTALKKKWQDPEWREALLAKRQAVYDSGKKKHGRPRKKEWARPHKMRWADARKLWKASRRKALKTVKKLVDAGIIDENDDNAKDAMTAALEVMRSPMSQQVKLQAAKLVLEYTMPKPVAKSEVTLNKAEDWLAAVVADAKGKNAQKDEEDDGEDA